MDGGKLDAIVNSIGLSMAVNDSYVVDCLLSPSDWDQCLQGVHMLFEDDDSLPDIIFAEDDQLVLENGSEINRINNRGTRGRRPHIVIVDELINPASTNDLYSTGASIITV